MIICNKIASVSYVMTDETINHIISKCRKLVQKKYKTKSDRVGKVIHWELCKRLKFDRTTKWYMLKPESVMEIETYNIWDFEIQMDYPVGARRSNLVLISKKKQFVIMWILLF